MRTERAIYISLLPPCIHACPAGENIQKWLAHVQSSEFQEAWQVIMEDNPLPAVHGRVCYHPCETDGNRAQPDGAVSIHAVERILGEKASEEGWRAGGRQPPDLPVRQARACRGSGTERPLGGVSPAAARPSSRNP